MRKFNVYSKFNVYLLMGVAVLFLLCPQVLNAQKSGTKVRTTVRKPKPATKTDPKPKPQTPAVADRQNAEPTEAEMKEALLKGMAERGGQRKADDSVEINNAIAGWIIKIERFEKLGCKLAVNGAGYFCTYNVTTSATVRSNDGTASGDRHAGAWNTLLRGMGARHTTATATRRFARGKGGWTATEE